MTLSDYIIFTTVSELKNMSLASDKLSPVDTAAVILGKEQWNPKNNPQHIMWIVNSSKRCLL